MGTKLAGERPWRKRGHDGIRPTQATVNGVLFLLNTRHPKRSLHNLKHGKKRLKMERVAWATVEGVDRISRPSPPVGAVVEE
jgi:hypothetical protein